MSVEREQTQVTEWFDEHETGDNQFTVDFSVTQQLY